MGPARGRMRAKPSRTNIHFLLHTCLSNIVVFEIDATSFDSLNAFFRFLAHNEMNRQIIFRMCFDSLLPDVAFCIKMSFLSVFNVVLSFSRKYDAESLWNYVQSPCKCCQQVGSMTTKLCQNFAQATPRLAQERPSTFFRAPKLSKRHPRVQAWRNLAPFA